MPQENKRRGRWAEKAMKKQKYEQEGFTTEEVQSNDNHNYHFQIDSHTRDDVGDDYVSFGPKPVAENETSFYGLLDQEEQEYYASINAKLEANDFDSVEDKTLFIQAVYHESRGKELKLVSSQACSRHLERIIGISTVQQTKELFERLIGHFLHLVQHRFASHCCEALFLKTARDMELCLGEPEEEENEGEIRSSEDLFLAVVNELEPDLGYLLTERFASHVVRLLLLILSGEPLEDVSASSVLASRKKEKLEKYEDDRTTEVHLGQRSVPNSFDTSLARMLASSVVGLDTTYIRSLATHPTGNPILQLLIRLELSKSGKSRAKDTDSIFYRLLPDEALAIDTESGKFIQGLIYDPTGSRLVETIIQHAPGKIFKKMYGNIFKDKMTAMAKNDIASYVAIRILERLGKDELEVARDAILSDIVTLVARNRLGVLRALVERSQIRTLDLGPITSALQTIYGDQPSKFLLNMLQKDHESPNNPTPKPSPQSTVALRSSEPTYNTHASLLAQALLSAPETHVLIANSIIALEPSEIITLSENPISSPILQSLLTSPHTSSVIVRTFIPLILSDIARLAADPSGSRVVDALWPATKPKILHFLREKVAAALEGEGEMIRATACGRAVWRNWQMGLWRFRRAEWGREDAEKRGPQEVIEGKVKVVGGRPQISSTRPSRSWDESGGQGQENKVKSKLDLARERFVKARQPQRGRGRGRGGILIKESVR